MPNVFTGKVSIPGDKMEEYLKVMEEAEKKRQPFVDKLNKLNEEFGEHLSEKGLSDRTVSKHCGIIDIFIDFLARYTDVEKIEDVTKGMANTHFKNWYRRKVWDSTTPNEISAAIKKFFTFLSENKGIVNENVLKTPKKGKSKAQDPDMIFNLILEKGTSLDFGEEDKKLVKKLINAYLRKRTGVTKSRPETTAAGLLWQYSRMNYLWEDDERWSRQELAELFGAKAKTAGDKASEISKALKIDLWDERFCRKDVSSSNPLKDMVMTPQGFILPKDSAKGIPTAPLRKGKEDYYYDGLGFLDNRETDKAVRCFKKALEIDDEYVDAYNGMGSVYFWDNIKKAKEYYQKAYEMTKKHFNSEWPVSIDWGVLENRQYLRAMHGLGLIFWRENNVQEAKRLFMLMLRLNNNDNQGVRYLVAAVLEGMSWDQYGEMEDNARETSDYSKEEELFERQNKIHNFYRYEGSR